MSIFTRALKWLKNAVKTGETKIAPIAIAITEAVKTALESGLPDFIAKFVETLFPQVHGLPDELLTIVKNNITKVLAAELALQALGADQSPEAIKAFEEAVLNAFGLHDKKSKLYTEMVVQIANDIDQFTNGGTESKTFAEWVVELETEYQKMKALEDQEG